MKTGLSIKTDTVAQLMKSLHALTGQDVLVGVPSNETERKEKGDPIDNATLAYIHEFGAPGAGIPARPALFPAIEENQPAIVEQFRKAAIAGLTGDKGEVDKRLHAAGLVAQNAVRAKINSGLMPALQEATLAARRRRGRTGTKPLIDTGQLRNAYTYVVRRK